MTKQTPQEYIESLKAAQTSDDIEVLATKLFDDCGIGQKHKQLSARARNNNLTPYHKAVRTEFNDRLELGLNAYTAKKKDGSTVIKHLHFKFTADRNDWDAINKPAQEKLTDRLDNPAIVHTDKYMECMVNALNSSDGYELSVGLIAASGRRSIEIWRLGEFTKTDDPYTVTFKGQAKRRDYGMSENQKPSFPIRLLIPAENFLRLWRQFKKTDEYKGCVESLKEKESQLKGISPIESEPLLNKAFHSLRGKSVDKAVKEIFADSGALEGLDAIKEGHMVSSHILRHATVNLLTMRDANTNAVGKQLLFAARQLGHFIDDVDRVQDVLASLGYINFEVMGQVSTMDDAFKVTHARINHSDLERFKAICSHLNARNQQQAFHWLLNLAERFIDDPESVTKTQASVNTSITETTIETPQQSEEKKPMAQDVEQIVSEMLDEKLAPLMAALSQGQTQADSIPTAPTEPDDIPTPKTVTTPAQYTLKRAKDARGEAADQKVNDAFWAIAAHNEKSLDGTDRWFINARALKDIAGVNYAVVKRWYAENEGMIDEHNSRNEIEPGQNRKHGKKGIKIGDVVSI